MLSVCLPTFMGDVENYIKKHHKEFRKKYYKKYHKKRVIGEHVIGEQIKISIDPADLVYWMIETGTELEFLIYLDHTEESGEDSLDGYVATDTEIDIYDDTSKGGGGVATIELSYSDAYDVRRSAKTTIFDMNRMRAYITNGEYLKFREEMYWNMNHKSNNSSRKFIEWIEPYCAPEKLSKPFRKSYKTILEESHHDDYLPFLLFIQTTESR